MLAEGPGQSGDLRALVERVGRGEADAFRALLDAVGPRLYGILLRSEGDEVKAAALLRSTLEEVWRLAPCYDRQSGPPIAWILALCRAEILDRAPNRTGSALGPPGVDTADPGSAALLERAWFGGLGQGPSSKADRERFALALRARTAGAPPGTEA